MTSWHERTFKPIRAVPDEGATIIPFPKKIGQRFNDFVRDLAGAQAAVELELRSSPGELRLDAGQLERMQEMDPYSCQLCEAPVYPIDGMWWDPDGTLHNYKCTGHRRRNA